MTKPTKPVNFGQWMADFVEETGIASRLVDAIARPLAMDKHLGATDVDAWLALRRMAKPTDEERQILDGCWQWMYPNGTPKEAPQDVKQKEKVKSAPTSTTEESDSES